MSTHCVTAHDDKKNTVLQEIHLQNLIFASVKGVSENIFVNTERSVSTVNPAQKRGGVQTTDY